MSDSYADDYERDDMHPLTDMYPENLPMLPSGVDRVADLGTVLTLQETAKRLGVSAKTVRRMIARNDLLGAHKVPMQSGKGEQWVVPVSSIEQAKSKTLAQAVPDHQAVELADLRKQVAMLQIRADLHEAIATERKQALDDLHMTMRMLNLGADKPASAEKPRRKWRRK